MSMPAAMYRDSRTMRRAPPGVCAAALALLPMAFAIAGALVDERTHLGYTMWRAACRASGVTLGSLLVFTAELLPAAVVGALLGGIALQIAGAALWHRTDGARTTLAAHAGCALGMAGGLLICVLVPSLPLMLAAETLLASGLAWLLCRWPATRARRTSVDLPTSAATSAY
jgi:hypothetical protein